MLHLVDCSAWLWCCVLGLGFGFGLRLLACLGVGLGGWICMTSWCTCLLNLVVWFAI